MEYSLYLQETSQVADILSAARNEFNNAVRNALLQRAYDTDIELSFANIHINPSGSVSQVSFNGSDVVDVDSFIAKQVLQLDDEHYFDIRKEIKNNPENFAFYPILINGKISFTVLKSSPYFERKYGIGIHDDNVSVEYASKYFLIYRNNWDGPDVYFTGLFGPEATANNLLNMAGKKLGGKAIVYYCFMNSRPELFLHLGQVKEDFKAYHPEKTPENYNFYTGTIISGYFKVNKITDDNGKIKVKESQRICFKHIIDMQYGSISAFCKMYDIDKIFLQSFLSGVGSTIKYTNGDLLTPTRLVEMLNLPFIPDAEGLKDKNLLIKVNYDDIPS